MFKSAILALGLLALSQSAFATTYHCELDMGRPGAPSYLLVVQSSLPGAKVEGIILSQTLGTGSTEWSLIDGNANVGRAADGGPLYVSSNVKGEIDWSDPKLKDECFVISGETYHFSLSERTNGVTGTVTISKPISRNPAKKANQCPQVDPYQGPPAKLTCKNF